MQDADDDGGGEIEFEEFCKLMGMDSGKAAEKADKVCGTQPLSLFPSHGHTLHSSFAHARMCVPTYFYAPRCR